MEQSHHFSLYALNALVHEAVSNALPDEYWVEAELAECRERNGHCYMELVEKDERSNSPIAKASAKCWRQTWTLLHATFLRATGQPLRAGMKVLLRVYPQFHEAYGFSWIVSDIDPTYTIGDLARRRQEIIKTLKAQGVFDLQRELRLSPFAQRIAVISAESAAGYGDFCRQLLDNEYDLQFQTELVPAIMQGERVEQSVIQALNLINNRIDDFDAVVIIRGGGATSDMSGFDTLPLAENVANFPLPIITGIGHDRDECVLDMVSHTRVKTPTAAATLLTAHLCNTLQQVADAENVIAHYAQDRLQRHRLQLEHITTLLPHLAQRLMTEAHHSLERIQLKLEGYDPQLLLQRGYSITLHSGQIVKNPQDVKSGDEIETRLKQGTIKSIIQ